MAKYDFLIVGAGLFGSVFAHEAMDRGYSCLVIDKRQEVGGNLRCEERDGIDIHLYGAHIFHTSNRRIWDYVCRFAAFNHYVNSPVANYRGQLYNLPFNMNTFNRMWGVVTPAEARRIIKSQQAEMEGKDPANLEEQAVALVGRDIYEKLIKGYTEKQWGRPCDTLPAAIIRRIPVRYRYDNNYFDDPYQGIPIGGYNRIIASMLEGADVETGLDYNRQRDALRKLARKVVYTGPLDALFDYRHGKLQYRSVFFEHQRLDEVNQQGVAVMNYTDAETPYTRIIEHKHFEFGTQPATWISREYPVPYESTGEPYYPVNDEVNQRIYREYLALAKADPDMLIGGRLAEYAYFDMDRTILSALALAEAAFGGSSAV